MAVTTIGRQAAKDGPGAITDRLSLDDEALRQIRIQASHLVRRGAFPRHERDEVEQQLALHVLKRIHAFDPRRASWRGFIAMLAKRAASNMLRARTAKKRDYRRLRHLTDAQLLEHIPASDGDDHAQIDLSLDVASCESSLPPDLLTISHSLKTASVSEAARSAGIPRSTFRDKAKALHRVYESAGLRIYVSD